MTGVETPTGVSHVSTALLVPSPRRLFRGCLILTRADPSHCAPAAHLPWRLALPTSRVPLDSVFVKRSHTQAGRLNSQAVTHTEVMSLPAPTSATSGITRSLGHCRCILNPRVPLSPHLPSLPSVPAPPSPASPHRPPRQHGRHELPGMSCRASCHVASLPMAALRAVHVDSLRASTGAAPPPPHEWAPCVSLRHIPARAGDSRLAHACMRTTTVPCLIPMLISHCTRVCVHTMLPLVLPLSLSRPTAHVPPHRPCAVGQQRAAEAICHPRDRLPSVPPARICSHCCLLGRQQPLRYRFVLPLTFRPHWSAPDRMPPAAVCNSCGPTLLVEQRQ
ncbi:unnamed protein product [Closterium sp. Naga37s-1]|nr:unnamed protein product [Closterium sp. Naga37s-1]